jgi:hypothetical protein
VASSHSERIVSTWWLMMSFASAFWSPPLPDRRDTDFEDPVYAGLWTFLRKWRMAGEPGIHGADGKAVLAWRWATSGRAGRSGCGGWWPS